MLPLKGPQIESRLDDKMNSKVPSKFNVLGWRPA